MASVDTLLNSMAIGASERSALKKLLDSVAVVPVPLSNVFETNGTTMTPITNATAPKRDQANGDTDSGIVITWIATNSDAIIFQSHLPPHVEAGDTITVKFRIKAGGSNDTPTVAADLYINEGDTKVEFTSAAVSSVVQELSVQIAGSDVPNNPRTLTCELTPGAHANDTLVLSDLWIEVS